MTIPSGLAPAFCAAHPRCGRVLLVQPAAADFARGRRKVKGRKARNRKRPRRRSHPGLLQNAKSEGSERLFELRQDGEEVADEAVVGDLEDRRLLVLVDGDDDLRVLHAGEMLDGAGDADRDVELRRDDLAGLADLPVVRRVAGVDGGTRCADGGAELVGDRQDDFLELLGRAERAAAGDDDLGRGQLRTVALGQPVLDEGRQAGVGRGRRTSRPAPSRPRRPREGGRAHGDDLLGVGRLHRLDRVAGIDRPLERVGRDHLDDLGDLRDVEQRGDARHDVLAGRGRGRDDRVVAGRERDDQARRAARRGARRVRRASASSTLATPVELRGGLGGGARALAGDQDMDVAADLERGRQRLGGLVGERRVVVFGDEKNGHVSVPSGLRARRLRSSACRPVRRPILTLTPALRPPGSSVFSTFRRGVDVDAEIGRASSRRAASSWPS